MHNRDEQIVEVIRESGFARIPDIAARLHVSESTVRRTLSRLEEQGMISRGVGGAVWNGRNGGHSHVQAFDERKQVALAEKIELARAAARFVSDGDTIFLGGGSTVGQMPPFLQGLTLQIVTNSLAIAAQFEDCPSTEVLVTGGYLFPRHRLLSGPHAVAVLQDLHFSVAFIGAGAFNAQVVTDWNLMMAEVNRTALLRADRGVALIDGTKYGRRHLARVCDTGELDVLITGELPAEDRRLMTASGVELIEATRAGLGGAASPAATAGAAR